MKILKFLEIKPILRPLRTFGNSCPFLGGERSGWSGSRAITEVCWICFLAASFSFLISTYSAFKFLRFWENSQPEIFFCWDFFEFHMSDNFQIIFILFGWILFTLLSDWNRSNSIPNRDRKISTAIKKILAEKFQEKWPFAYKIRLDTKKFQKFHFWAEIVIFEWKSQKW